MYQKEFLSKPWIKRSLLVFSGLISCFAFAPNYFFPSAVIGFSWFFYVLSKTNNVSIAFWQGWLFGIGYNIGTLCWIGNSLTTVGFWYLSPLGSIFLPGCLAFFQAIVAWLVIKFSKTQLGRFFLFCLFWSLTEWLKGWIFTGFPWNLVGYIWDLDVLQLTAYVGIYGLSALTISLLISFGTLRLSLIAINIIAFASVWGIGHYRLQHNPTEHTGINIRVVQASIPQTIKWQKESFEENLNKWITLSNLEAERPLKAIIWAESSVPTFIEDYAAIRHTLAEAVPSGGVLITGGPRKVREGDRALYLTSTFIIGEGGNVLASYDKSHLVPFGEYMPLSKWLPFVKLTSGTENYSPGNGIRTLVFKGLPSVSPLICYEAIFPGNVVAEGKRPEWLLNQTNDAWFGESFGPYQHLGIVRVRAIEEGLPLVRSANNGISAVIDSLGRILYQINLNEIGFIDFELPKFLTDPTIFSLYKNLGFWIILASYGVLVLIFNRKKY